LDTDALGAEITKTLRGWLISLEEKLFWGRGEALDECFGNFVHNIGYFEKVHFEIVLQQPLKWWRRSLPVSSRAPVAAGKGVGRIGPNFEAVRRGGKCWVD